VSIEGRRFDERADLAQYGFTAGVQMLAEDLNVAFLVVQEPEKEREGSGLAGAVRPEKAVNAATLYAEVNVVKGLQVSGIMIRKPGCPNNRLLIHEEGFSGAVAISSWRRDATGQ